MLAFCVTVMTRGRLLLDSELKTLYRFSLYEIRIHRYWLCEPRIELCVLTLLCSFTSLKSITSALSVLE